MKQMKAVRGAVLVLVLALASSGAWSAEWRAELESGVAAATYNTVSVPNATGTRFSLIDDLDADVTFYVRGRFTYSWGGRNTVSILMAPLTIESSARTDKNILFKDVDFPAGTDVRARYTFNSYRLTYRRTLSRGARLTFGLGVTAKIRDAAIRLEGDDRVAEEDNVGFVPLINFDLDVRLTDRLRFSCGGDALAAPQGRAEDIALLAHWAPVRRLELSLGYRILEGGADVDSVYNFALIHYAVIGISVRL
ncbi:MAG TPA: hypothetical protein VM118_04370 [Acidobacteriota bacterium]|nr:hypothetical protein [Acidobacteriota bacterium]